MANLTISVDDELIKRARIRAIQQGTSLSAKLREYLQQYVEETDEQMRSRRADVAASLLQTIEAATAHTQVEAEPASGSGGPAHAPPRRTLRDALYGGDFRARDRDRIDPAG